MARVTEARALPDYRLWLRFADGTEGEVDLSDFVGKGVFSAWSDAAVFESVRVADFGAPEWPGEIDLCPDSLYMEVTGLSVDEYLGQPEARASA